MSQLAVVKRLNSVNAVFNNTSFDRQMMARALQLAERGRYWTRPNPHVGCVLTRDGAVIGEGFTQPAGGNHAEVEALQMAGDARGATAYVTLEPCSHQGRTGPCAEALVKAGVRRVVAAMEDPNPLVSGRGLARLQEAGVTVESGLLQVQAEAAMTGFILRMRRGWGRVRAKVAASVDGRTAMASGESQWITGAAARQDVQRLRAQSGAIVTGVGTVLADDCTLTVRSGELGLPATEAARVSTVQPLRVVLDSAVRTPASANVLNELAPTLLCYDKSRSAPVIGVDSLGLPAGEFGLDLHVLMTALGERQCNEILVESGPRLTGAFLRAGLIDELIVYMAPVLLGSKANPLLCLPLEQMSDKVPLTVKGIRQVGTDIRFIFVPA